MVNKELSDKLELHDLEIKIFQLSYHDKSFFLKIINNLEPYYFNSPILEKIFFIIKKFFNQYQSFPSKKLLQALLEKTDVEQKYIDLYIKDIYSDKIDISEKNYIISETIKFAKRTRLKLAILESTEALKQNDFDKILNTIKDAIQFNLDINMGVDLYDIDERYLRLKENLDNKLTTGYSSLDEILKGGWAKKELYALQAPPGVGKTIFLVNFGANLLKHGYNVVHYTLEMSEERLGLRYDGVITKIHLDQLSGNIDEIKKKYNVLRKITKSHLIIKEFPTSAASIYDLESHLENLKIYKDFIPDVIIVDYGDIMKSTRKTKNLYEEQGFIFRELRALAITYNCAVITATQSKRESLASDGGTKEIIGMDQVADSMEKNRILDVLLSITQSAKEKEENKINLWVSKNRNGKAHILLPFLINYETMIVKEPLLEI